MSGTGSGISWTICKSAPRSRQITTPAPHHSVFLQVGCYSCHPTNSVKALKAKVAGELTAKSCITVATYQIRLRISTAGQILPIFTMGREMPSKISPFRGGILPPTHPFNRPLSGTTRVSRYQKGKPICILLKQETVSGSGISWTICKSAPRSRQITMPAPHHSVFYRLDALPAMQPTASKH